jgi:hypothetical protein
MVVALVQWIHGLRGTGIFRENLRRTWYARLFRREVGKSLRKSKEHRCGISTLVAENPSHTGGMSCIAISRMNVESTLE